VVTHEPVGCLTLMKPTAMMMMMMKTLQSSLIMTVAHHLMVKIFRC